MTHDWSDAIQTEFWRRVNSDIAPSPLEAYQRRMAQYKRQDAVRQAIRNDHAHNCAVARQHFRVV